MSMDITLILEIPAVSKEELIKELLRTESGDKLLNTLVFYSGKTIRMRINKRIPRPNSPDRERLPDTSVAVKNTTKAQEKTAKQESRQKAREEKLHAIATKQAEKDAAKLAKKAEKESEKEAVKKVAEKTEAAAQKTIDNKPTKKSHHNPAKGY